MLGINNLFKKALVTAKSIAALLAAGNSCDAVTFVPYRTAIELCALDHGGLTPCDGGSNGIPSPTTTRYLSAILP